MFPFGVWMLCFFFKKLRHNSCGRHTTNANNIRARHLLLTPLNKTLSQVHPETRVIAMVLGTQDRFLTGRALASFCEGRGIRHCLIEGVNHSLKDDVDPRANYEDYRTKSLGSVAHKSNHRGSTISDWLRDHKNMDAKYQSYFISDQKPFTTGSHLRHARNILLGKCAEQGGHRSRFSIPYALVRIPKVCRLALQDA